MKLLVASLLSLVPVASATTYYLAPTGADNAKNKNGPGSREQPFKTANYAAKQLQPGDELVLLDGEYLNDNYANGDIWKTETTLWMPDVVGSADAPITIRGDTKDGHTLKGDSNSVLDCRRCQHVVLRDLNVVGELDNIPQQDAWDNRFLHRLEGGDGTDQQRMDPSWDAATIDAWFEEGNALPTDKTNRPSLYNTRGLLIHSAQNVLVEGCTIKNMPGAGIKVQDSDRITIRGNTVHDCTRRSSLGTHGILVMNGKNLAGGDGYRFVVENNLAYNNYNEVYSWVDHKNFLKPHIDEGKGIVVAHLNSDEHWQTGRALMANNVAYNNGLSGIHAINSDRLDIYFNTAYQNIVSGEGTQTGISFQQCKDVDLQNNIAVSNNDFGGKVYAINGDIENHDINLANNLAVGELQGTLEAYQDRFLVVDTADDLFEDTHNGDFRLRGDNNPAVGAGTYLAAVPKDKSGTDRSDPATDLGAYVFGAQRAQSGGFNPLAEEEENGESNGGGSDATTVFESTLNGGSGAALASSLQASAMLAAGIIAAVL